MPSNADDLEFSKEGKEEERTICIFHMLLLVEVVLLNYIYRNLQDKLKSKILKS